MLVVVEAVQRLRPSGSSVVQIFDNPVPATH
jgi:hypothetical protein